MNRFYFLLLFIFLNSCRPLPSVTTFVDASSQLRKGVNTGFSAIQRTLQTDDLVDGKELIKDEKQLKEIMTKVDQSLLGITAYAGALNSLVASGNAGAKNAAQVADGLTKIVEQIVPQFGAGAPIVPVASDLIAKIYGQIAKVRAANNLYTIMMEADSTVSAFQSVYSDINSQLLKYNKAIYQKKKVDILAPNSLTKNTLDYIDALNKEQIALYNELTLLSEFRSTTNTAEIAKRTLNTLKKIDPIIEKDTSNSGIEARQGDLVMQSKRIDTEKNRIQPMIVRIEEAQQKYAEEYSAIEQLLQKSNEAIRIWAATHTEIKNQLQRKGTPNFQELTEIIEDVRELKDKLKKLNP